MQSADHRTILRQYLLLLNSIGPAPLNHRHALPQHETFTISRVFTKVIQMSKGMPSTPAPSAEDSRQHSCNRPYSTTWSLTLFGGEGVLPAGPTQRTQANRTAGGLRKSLTSEIRLTPLPQEVPSART
jgi:hypothetical protein